MMSEVVDNVMKNIIRGCKAEARRQVKEELEDAKAKNKELVKENKELRKQLSESQKELKKYGPIEERRDYVLYLAKEILSSLDRIKNVRFGELVDSDLEYDAYLDIRNLKSFIKKNS